MNVLTANILATNSLLSTSQRHARVNSGEAGPVLSTPQRHARSCDSWIGVLSSQPRQTPDTLVRVIS
jgi:hypothetical protein